MPPPSDSALRGRARAMLEAMTERARWVYAVPRDPDDEAASPARPRVRAMLEAEGLRCEEEDAVARVARLLNGRGTATFVLFDSPELDALFVQAEGGDAPPILAKVLDATGFHAQSELLRRALDVAHPATSKALRTLAHMVVAWDEDWSDLFLLHLASPDPVARHEATLSLTVAAMVARDPGPAKALLDEAIRREKFPKLRDTMQEALRLVEAMTGGPLELNADAPEEGDEGGAKGSA